MMSLQNLVLFISFMELLPLVNAGPIIDSKRVESCNNEGDLKGNCKDHAFCYCQMNKWICSFDVKMVDPAFKEFKDLCNPCEPICPIANIEGGPLNITHFLSLTEQTGPQVDACNATAPCQHNGTCIPLSGTSSSYNCSCTDGWEGINCETDINECVETPCKNNASCINTQGSYLCICSNGWTGIACDKDIDECIDPSYEGSLCYNNATCSNTNGSYACNCSTGWEGQKCERDIDECRNTTVCTDGCINTPGSYRCLCEAGLTGDFCNQDIDECSVVQNDDPLCYNNGSCFNTYGSYRCNCTDDWEGLKCETDINECQNNTLCKFECINTPGSFRCLCQAGWTGEHCHQDIDECIDPSYQGTLCDNNATCSNTDGSYTCNCSTGWEGQKCERDIDECQGGLIECADECINTPGSYRCLCKAGLTGDNCNQDKDECSVVQEEDPLCYNNGSCFNTHGSYRCNCTVGWEGLKCETDINECHDIALCKLECINTPGSFRCLCEAGWTGEHCDQDIDECVANITGPCHNKGTCVNTVGSFTCNCTTNWGGATCDYPINFARRIEYWNNPENQRRQLETLNNTLLEIKANLTIEKTELTSSRIKRISAPDPRQSAAITGYLGAGVISFVFGILLCLDLTLCFHRSDNRC